MINDVMPPNGPQRSKPIVIEPDPPRPEDKAPTKEMGSLDDSLFKTPDEVAAHDEPAATLIVAHHDKNGDKTSAHHTATDKKPWYKISWPLSRKQQIIAGALAVVLAFGIGAAWTLTHHKRAVVADKPKKSTQKKVAPPAPIYSNLSGLQITDASLNQKPVTAVMVENSIDARPQSGLNAAGVVFEAVAEGGVTRFMALYQDTAPNNVGPIRSARPYYIQWALGFDAAYAHVGGSPDALADISSWGVKDMNQFSNGSFYHRINERAAPHNVYTGIDTLNQLEASKGYTSTFTGFTRKKEPSKQSTSHGAKPTTSSTQQTAPTTASQPAVTNIDLSLSGYTYDPHYDYNAASNSYNRSEAGQPQVDANTNAQLNPKVVIAIVVPMARGALDSSGAYYSDYNPIGVGTAYIFQDGVLTTGQWNKASNAGALTFTDSNGQPLPLNPGQTWITAVTSTAGVKYK
jgi:hypothetical protein